MIVASSALQEVKFTSTISPTERRTGCARHHQADSAMLARSKLTKPLQFFRLIIHKVTTSPASATARYELEGERHTIELVNSTVVNKPSWMMT